MAGAPDSKRKEKLLAKRKQLEAQIAAIDARRRTKERRLMTRQKIIVGASVLNEANHNPEFKAALTNMLERNVVREADRVVIKEFLKQSI